MMPLIHGCLTRTILFGPDDATFVALASTYYRALGLAETSITEGESGVYEAAEVALRNVITNAAAVGNVSVWWTATLTLHLAADLWDQSLHVRLPDGRRENPDGDPKSSMTLD